MRQSKNPTGAAAGTGAESNASIHSKASHHDANANNIAVNLDELSNPSSNRISDLARRLSFTDQDDYISPFGLLSQKQAVLENHDKQELTLFSEEGIADMYLPDDILIQELEFLDNITSCNKVENCLMLSEYEQNLIKETESPRRGGSRRWSLLHEDHEAITIGVGGIICPVPCGVTSQPRGWKNRPHSSSSSKNNHMAVIEEASSDSV